MNLEPYRKDTKKLACLPGVEAIFLSGSIAQGRNNAQSDIDLFIISRPGMIWTARFFVYITLFLAGNMRRTGKEAGKYCPNHFITSDHLEIQEQDAYSAHLFSHNIPLQDKNNIFVQFKSLNQEWIESFGESFQHKTTNPGIITTKSKISFFLQIQEYILKRIQIWKAKRHPNYKTPGACIIFRDQELRFHAHPKNKSWKK